MKVYIHQLNDGHNELHFLCQTNTSLNSLIKTLRKEGVTLLNDLRADLKVTKLEPDYFIQTAMAFTASLRCSRCAEPFPQAIKHTFDVAFRHEREPSPPDTDDSETHYFEGHSIDLEPITMEQILLSLPYQPLCKVDCKGICQRCGQDLNESTCQCSTEKVSSPFSAIGRLDLK